MAIDSGLKKSDGVDLGNNLFAGNGSSSGNQTFNIIQKNGIDLGRGWYNKSACYSAYGNIGFKNSAGVDVGTLLGRYGTLNCNCDCNCDCDSDSDGGCFVFGQVLTSRGLVDIYQIQVGDMIWGTDERWHLVLGIATSHLGKRNVYVLANGGVVTADHVVFFGDVGYVPCKGAVTNTVLQASNGVKGVYAVPPDVSEIDGAILKSVSSDTVTYSPICDCSFVGYLNGERVLFAGAV